MELQEDVYAKLLRLGMSDALGRRESVVGIVERLILTAHEQLSSQGH
jgi:hypothetical protein